MVGYVAYVQFEFSSLDICVTQKNETKQLKMDTVVHTQATVNPIHIQSPTQNGTKAHTLKYVSAAQHSSGSRQWRGKNI